MKWSKLCLYMADRCYNYPANTCPQFTRWTQIFLQCWEKNYLSSWDIFILLPLLLPCGEVEIFSPKLKLSWYQVKQSETLPWEFPLILVLTTTLGIKPKYIKPSFSSGLKENHLLCFPFLSGATTSCIWRELSNHWVTFHQTGQTFLNGDQWKSYK